MSTRFFPLLVSSRLPGSDDFVDYHYLMGEHGIDASEGPTFSNPTGEDITPTKELTGDAQIPHRESLASGPAVVVRQTFFSQTVDAEIISPQDNNNSNKIR